MAFGIGTSVFFTAKILLRKGMSVGRIQIVEEQGTINLFFQYYPRIAYIRGTNNPPPTMTFDRTKPLLVILTDDDEDDREIFEETIEEIDGEIKVVTLTHGKALMDYLCDATNNLPDLIFLDINMPYKNGHECLVEIRNNPRLKSLCVIMYSTSDYSRDIKRAYKLGADGFIQKPSNHSVLKNILQKTLQTEWKDPCSKLEEHRFVLQA